MAEFEDDVRVVGQPPLMVELLDDKEFVHGMLRQERRFTMPECWMVESLDGLKALANGGELTFPIVGKRPVRDGGSLAVKVCHDAVELEYHVRALLKDSPRVMLEEYLAGEEATITVFPPSFEEGRDDYWASPIVARLNYGEGVAPMNSIIEVTSKSKVLASEDYEQDVHYQAVAKECEEVARLLRVTAAIRVDVRRFKEGKFALFGVSVKPVSLTFLFIIH